MKKDKKLLDDLDAELDHVMNEQTYGKGATSFMLIPDDRLDNPLSAEIMIPKGKGDAVAPYMGNTHAMINKMFGTYTVEKVEEREKGPTTLTMKPVQEVTEDVEYTEEKKVIDKTLEDFKKTCAMDRRQFRTEDGIVGVFKFDDAGKPVFVPIDPEDMKSNEIPWRISEPPRAYDGSKLPRYSMGIDPYDGPKDFTAIAIRDESGIVSTSRSDEIHFPELLEELKKYNWPTLIIKEKPPVIAGQDILTIRALTGKRKDEAIKALNAATVEMMDKASPDCFYIPHDVRSSKNSKEIGRFKKRNALGHLEDFTTLVESKAAKAYRKATAGYWMQNKVAFLNQSRGLKLPLKIEFTFIRETLRKFDMNNGSQILADMMVEFGYMVDDETAYFIPVFNPVVYYHRELCGVLIRIIK